MIKCYLRVQFPTISKAKFQNAQSSVFEAVSSTPDGHDDWKFRVTWQWRVARRNKFSEAKLEEWKVKRIRRKVVRAISPITGKTDVFSFPRGDPLAGTSWPLLVCLFKAVTMAPTTLMPIIHFCRNLVRHAANLPRIY